MAKLTLLFVVVLCMIQILRADHLREVEEEITPSRIKEIREMVEKSVKSLHDKIESAEVLEKSKQHIENKQENRMDIVKDFRLKYSKLKD